MSADTTGGKMTELSKEAVESALHTARVCTRCEYIKHTWPDGYVNERYPYVGFWTRFMSSLETRQELTEKSEANTEDSQKGLERYG